MTITTVRRAVALTVVVITSVLTGTGCETDESVFDAVTATTADSDVVTTTATAATEAPSTTAPPTTEAPTTTEALPELDAATLETLFLIVVNANGGPMAAQLPDDFLVEKGHEMCDLLDEANGNAAVVVFAMSAAVLESEGTQRDRENLTALLGTILGAAPTAFCPEWEDEVAAALGG